MSSVVEIAIAVFAVSNGVRVVAYVPQIIRVAYDRDGAAAISCLTWLLFAVSHLSTVAYAVVVIDDWRMATNFGANMLCCLLIIGLTMYKRAVSEQQLSVERLTEQ
jgi:hypothetical protein